MPGNLFFGADPGLDPARPLYLQIIEGIQRAVARGEIKPGDKVPSQRELAQQLKINPNTVQRAYREMEHMGLVKTLRGTGTFLTDDAGMAARLRERMAADAIEEMFSALAELGYSRPGAARLAAEAAEAAEAEVDGAAGPADAPEGGETRPTGRETGTPAGGAGENIDHGRNAGEHEDGDYDGRR